MRTIGQYRTYYTSKASVPSTTDAEDVKASRKAIVILPDVFGLGINNPKLIADMLNDKVGCDVYVPDTFVGKVRVDDSTVWYILLKGPTLVFRWPDL